MTLLLFVYSRVMCLATSFNSYIQIICQQLKSPLFGGSKNTPVEYILYSLLFEFKCLHAVYSASDMDCEVCAHLVKQTAMNIVFQ